MKFAAPYCGQHSMHQHIHTILDKTHPINWTPLVCKLRNWPIIYIADYDNIQVYPLCILMQRSGE